MDENVHINSVGHQLESGTTDEQETFSRERYSKFHEMGPIGYLVLGPGNVIVDVNMAGAQLIGNPRNQLINRDLGTYIVNDFQADFRMCLESIGETKQWQECETEIVRTDGSKYYALVQGREVEGTGELVLFISDISERKKTENALKESEQKYRDVADRLAEGVFEADTTGKVTYANHKILTSLQLNDEDINNGINVFDVIAPKDLNLAKERVSRVLKQEDVGAGEYELVRKNGTTFSALVHSLAIIREGKVSGIRGIMIDISERKQVETALQESERRYRELAELLGAGIFELEKTGVLTYANRKGLILFGFDENDLKNGINVFDVIEQDNLEEARKNFMKVLEQEDIGAIEYTLIRKDGMRFTGLTYSSPIVREGTVVGVRGVVVDITQLKQAEQALRNSEQKYRELSDLLDEGVIELDLQGKFTYANRKALCYIGIEEDDLKTGISVFDIVSANDLERAKERLAMAANGQDTGPVEFEIVRKDGTSFPALTHGSAILRDGVVIGIRGVVFDISELKDAERALKESEERFRTFVRSLREGIWVLDKEDMTTFVNPRMAEMLGYTTEEMVGKPVYAFSEERWKEISEYYMARRKQGVKEQIECEFLRKDGGKVYALLETSPILDENGKYVGSIAGVQDITERKSAEEKLKHTMAELDRSNKELEQFAYVTSHDLREPLRMMTSFSQLLEKKYKDKLDTSANEYIHFIVDGSARMQRLIDDILVYSRVTTRGQPLELVDMETALQEVLLNLKAALDETKATITFDKLPTIQADPTQIKQVFQNLIANAIKFHKETEAPVVQISAKDDGNEWLFSVKDNGIGMDPELFGKLFNLFQRLHPPDKYPGTGVGLAVTKKIVQRHGGKIWVESQPGNGSTFYFTIPKFSRVEKDGRK